LGSVMVNAEDKFQATQAEIEQWEKQLIDLVR
jgi:hypothetical protein